MVIYFSQMKTRLKIRIMCLLFCLLRPEVYSEKVNDTFEMRVNIPPVFSLTIETYMLAPEAKYSPSDLIEPSKNVIVPDSSLQGEINLGHLIARKKGNELLPLVSEYKVLLKAKCDSNQGNLFLLSQTLDSPLTGEQTGQTIPSRAFVCNAEIDSQEGRHLGNVLLSRETPIIPGSKQEIYQSGEAGQDYLGNVIDIFYWITDDQDEKVKPDQRADTYKSTITFTMVEL